MVVVAWLTNGRMVVVVAWFAYCCGCKFFRRCAVSQMRHAPRFAAPLASNSIVWVNWPLPSSSPAPLYEWNHRHLSSLWWPLLSSSPAPLYKWSTTNVIIVLTKNSLLRRNLRIKGAGLNKTSKFVSCYNDLNKYAENEYKFKYTGKLIEKTDITR